MHLPPLSEGRLIRRYKRFLADVELPQGAIVTAHCANPGSMLGLNAPGSRVWLSRAADPARKLAWTWELVEAGTLVGLHTGRANAIVAEAIAAGLIGDLAGYATVRREVAYGTGSRVDFLLEDPARGRAFVEVKSVTLSRAAGLAEFPDSRTTRGTRHLDDLGREVAAGHRALLVFLVQRADCTRVAVAADIDPAYASAFRAARMAGVEVVALGCRVSPQGITAAATLTVA